MFKKFEVIGVAKDEAIAQAAPMNLMVDATQTYNKWKAEHIESEDNVKDWMKDYLRKKKYDKPNMGAYIVLQSAVKDTRERPYKIETIKYEAKTHTPESFYVLRDEEGNVVGKEKTKKAAEEFIRKYIIENKKNVFGYREWLPKEKNSLVLKGMYTPSKGSKPCKLLVFGYQPVD